MTAWHKKDSVLTDLRRRGHNVDDNALLDALDSVLREAGWSERPSVLATRVLRRMAADSGTDDAPLPEAPALTPDMTEDVESISVAVVLLSGRVIAVVLTRTLAGEGGGARTTIVYHDADIIGVSVRPSIVGSQVGAAYDLMLRGRDLDDPTFWHFVEAFSWMHAWRPHLAANGFHVLQVL